MSGLVVVHVLYNALRDLPGRYNLCTHSLSALFGYYFGELYISVQQVYENAVDFRFLTTVWLTDVSSLGVVHLLYNTLWDLPGRYNLCTHSLSVLFGYYFGELYISVQQVYVNVVGFRLLSMVC